MTRTIHIVCRDRGDVTVDGEPLRLEPSLALMNHSPTGFAWGYGGSGPAQLALAILLHVTGDEGFALYHYQQFKWDHVAKWGPWGPDVVDVEVDLAAWLAERERTRL